MNQPLSRRRPRHRRRHRRRQSRGVGHRPPGGRLRGSRSRGRCGAPAGDGPGPVRALGWASPSTRSR